MQLPKLDGPSASSTPVISIIIPTYERQGQLVEMVKALGTCHFARQVEVIVVDQSASPLQRSAYEGLAQRFFDLLIMFYPRPNVSAARNAGAVAARAPILLFLDDDIRIGTEYLEVLSEIFSRGDADVVGGRICSSLQPRSDFADVKSVGWLSTGNFAILRTCFMFCGGFDENLSIGIMRMQSSHTVSGFWARKFLNTLD